MYGRIVGFYSGVPLALLVIKVESLSVQKNHFFISVFFILCLWGFSVPVFKRFCGCPEWVVYIWVLWRPVVVCGTEKCYEKCHEKCHVFLFDWC